MHRSGILSDLNAGQRVFSDNIGENRVLLRDNFMNDDDDSEFAGLMAGVKRLHNDRINVYRHRGHKKFVPRSQDHNAAAPANYPSMSTPACKPSCSAAFGKGKSGPRPVSICTVTGNTRPSRR
jgi:hypothetical protein